MPAVARPSTHFVRPMVRALAAAGVDVDRFLERQGLTGDHPRRIPADGVVEAWKAATAITGDPAIGIRAALVLSPGDFGVLEYAARSSSSLREAFERVSRYHELLNDRAALEFHDDADTTLLLGFSEPSAFRRWTGRTPCKQSEQASRSAADWSGHKGPHPRRSGHCATAIL